MIQCQVKLRLTKAQERECERYLYHLASIWNWGVRKIEVNAADKIYFSQFEFQNLLAGHSKRLNISARVLNGILRDVHVAWDRCFKKTSGRPRFKGKRNRLNSISFPDVLVAKGCRFTLTGIGPVRFHKMVIPEGRIKCSRMVKRASGWYLCLFIDASSTPIERIAEGIIGIDPGFSSLLTTSDGEVIEHPRELEASAKRLAQAQRGNNKKLAARIQERIANRKKDRNHKLSRRLVAENVLIAFSKDNTAGIAKRFGKSVASSSHTHLRRLISYKAASSGCEYIEVASKNSTRRCSSCLALTGPTGLAELSVRVWVCSGCGSHHDRDTNAAINTLKTAAGLAVEEVCHA